MSNKCITIGRQYGSGGREVGKRLAKKLGIPFYDRELLFLAAEQSGMDPGLMEDFDEKRSDGFLYSFAALSNTFLDPGGASLPYEIFQAECKAIGHLAHESPCIFIGRCADFALEDVCDVLNVFIYSSSMEDRIRRAKELDQVSTKNIVKYISRMDMQRRSYYNFFTEREWGAMETYDLCLNTSSFGFDSCVDILVDLYQRM